MTEFPIPNLSEVYDLVGQIERACWDHGSAELWDLLDGAMQLGSSGLEITGALRVIFLDHRDELASLLGPGGAEQVTGVIEFIDRIWGGPVQQLAPESGG